MNKHYEVVVTQTKIVRVYAAGVIEAEREALAAAAASALPTYRVNDARVDASPWTVAHTEILD